VRAIPGLFTLVNSKIWQCNYADGDPPNFSYRTSLEAACELDTYSLGFLVVSDEGEDVLAVCELSDGRGTSAKRFAHILGLTSPISENDHHTATVGPAALAATRT
jgi:hypothetical protein